MGAVVAGTGAAITASIIAQEEHYTTANTLAIKIKAAVNIGLYSLHFRCLQASGHSFYYFSQCYYD